MEDGAPLSPGPAQSQLVRVRVRVTGRVQGVWFRESCRRYASKLGLAGYVRNVPDGSVEAEFEGPAYQVERAVAWCHEGSARAVVAGVALEEKAPRGDDGFEVR